MTATECNRSNTVCAGRQPGARMSGAGENVNDDLLRSLRQLQEQAAGLQEVAASLQAPAVEPVERGDHTGAFRVRLDEDGVPDRIRVASDWVHRVSPEDIGQAVLEAYGAATSVRMQSWEDHLRRSNWQEQMLRPATDRQCHAPEPWTAESQDPPPRMDEVAEAAIAALRSAATSSTVDAEQSETPGVNSARRAVVLLPQGRMATCEIDARWARRQSSRSLADVLGRALQRARETLHQEQQEKEAARVAQAKRTRDLFGAALQILKKPERFSGM